MSVDSEQNGVISRDFHFSLSQLRGLAKAKPAERESRDFRVGATIKDEILIVCAESLITQEPMVDVYFGPGWYTLEVDPGAEQIGITPPTLGAKFRQIRQMHPEHHQLLSKLFNVLLRPQPKKEPFPLI